MITTDDIRIRFEYLEKLPIDGWIWEFLRRSKTFRSIVNAIKQHAARVELSLSDDKPNTRAGFRIEMPSRFSDRLTTLEHEFGFRPNMREEEELDPQQFTIIRIEDSPRVMAFPNLDLKYTEFCKIKPCIVGVVPVKHAVIGPAMVKEWKTGDSDIFHEQCTKLITTVLPPSSIEDTLYLGISRKAKSADIVKYIEKLLGEEPRSDTRETSREWKYYLIVYDLRTEKEQGKNDLSLYDLAELLSPIYLADRTKKKDDQRELESSDISRYNKKARNIIKGDFRKYLPRKLNDPLYSSLKI
jgi:hypothetical protein